MFVIAEIGGNHEGDFERAKKLTRLAIESGCHAIKFQTYKGDKLVSKVEGESRNKHFKRFELDYDQFIELAKMIREAGRIFMTSVWDTDSLNMLDEYLDIYKVGSGDLTNYEMLEAFAKRNKPIIISTAMATIDEIKESIKFIETINPKLIKKNKIVLLHCIAMYGDPRNEYANLLSIKKLQDEFPHMIIGYSDHTKGMYACELAVAMGSAVIEKHFTDDKTKEFRDNHISADVDELREFMKKTKMIRTMLGSYAKKPIDQIETSERISEFRRAVYPKTYIKAGEVLTRNSITALVAHE